jgi:hypothetical protein
VASIRKLAGQCGKLSALITNWPVEDARRAFPKINGPLRTAAGEAHLFKTDVYRGIMCFGYESGGHRPWSRSPWRVAEVAELNRKGRGSR